MAFNLANSSHSLPGTNAPVNLGPELEEITTESLGFLSLAGEAKVRLLPSQWPTDNLPPPTSSLLSVSSLKGLLAAASPDAVVVATTESVRQAFSSQGDSENKIKNFTPQLIIPAPRVSQVCFTIDGNYLIISAESGGGLAVYETQSLLRGNKQAAFEIATEGVPVRSVVPSPVVDNANVLAVVLQTGQLMLAHLGEKKFMPGANGPILKDDVSCVSWSNKGKQIVAGLGDGTAIQLEPSGIGKATIPRPPGVGPDQHVSSIIWLANDEFLIVHNPTNAPESNQAPESTYHFVRTNKERSSFVFQKLPMDPAPPFGMPRIPPSHYFCRLRGWHHLLDSLVVSSVASADIGLITKSDVPLTRDLDAERITSVYTSTTFVSDSRRAQLPMSIVDDMTDTSPIGMALDLSATEKVYRPIPGDEIDDSPNPLPAMMLLNHEGILSAWWVVYDQAVREAKIYPGMMTASSSVSAPNLPSSPSSQTSPFNGVSSPKQQVTSFGSPFAKPAAPAFGQSGFGASTGGNAFGASGFGGASQLGARQSPWVSAGVTSQSNAPTFGQSTFGQASKLGQPAFGSTTAFGASAATGSSFGAVGGMGQKQSPWVTQAASSNEPSKVVSPFGDANAKQSPFGKFAGTQSSFASMGAQGQSAFGQQAMPAQSIFAATSTPSTSFGMSGMSTPQPSFGSTVTIDSNTDGSTLGSKSIFGTPAQMSSVFSKPAVLQADRDDEAMEDDSEKEPPKEAPKPTGGLFGLDNGGFKLGSTFKADTASSKDEQVKKESGGTTMFGSDFSAALGGKQVKPSHPIKQEPATERTNIFGMATKKDAPSQMKASPLTLPPLKPAEDAKITPARNLIVQAPEPPLVTSKPISSPITAPSTEPSSKPSSVEDLPPAVELPTLVSEEEDSGDLEDESGEVDSVEEGEDEESAEEVIERAPLPPDPRKMQKPDWFYKTPPGARPVEQGSLAKPPPKAPSPPPATESPVFSSGGSGGSGAGVAKMTTVTTTTPAGFPKAPLTFQPPSAVIRESPRSPSPMRSASTPVISGRGTIMPPTLTASPTHQHILRPFTRPPAPQRPPEETVTIEELSDEEDTHIRAELEKPIQASTTLAPFITHQDYVGEITKTGLAAAIERLYRDVNSMIDILGLNSRTIQAFIKGHLEHFKDAGRERGDLENAQDWVLVETENLGTVQEEVEADIEANKLQGVDVTMAELTRVRKCMGGLLREGQAMKKKLEQLRDPKRRRSVREAPLEEPLANEQRRLREGFARHQKLLVEAEEAVTVLRARIAAVQGKRDDGKIPTVEAVENTIRKMTAMAQEKSAEVDVLERSMRKLGIAPSTPSRDSPTRPMTRDSMRSSTPLRSSWLAASMQKQTPTKAGTTFKTPGYENEEDEDEVEVEDGDEDPVEVERRKQWEEKVRKYKTKRERRKIALGHFRDAVLKKHAAEIEAKSKVKAATEVC